MIFEVWAEDLLNLVLIKVFYGVMCQFSYINLAYSLWEQTDDRKNIMEQTPNKKPNSAQN